MEWEEVEEGVAEWEVEALDEEVEWVKVVQVLVAGLDVVGGGLVSSPANTAPVGERGSAAHGLPGGLVLMVAETVDGTGGPPGISCTMTTT